jgi:hypothetical protein
LILGGHCIGAQVHVKRALLFFKRKEKNFFDFTLFLGVPRGIFPEKMTPVIEKLVPQQLIDACGLSNCMSRARHFSLNSNEKIFLTSPSF